MATRPVFTSLLWEGNLGGPIDVFSDPVPPGFIWVVRDIVWYVGGFPQSYQQLLELRDSAGAKIAAVTNYALTGNTFHHLELRQALNVGDNMRLVFNGVNLTWRITGYVLTLP